MNRISATQNPHAIPKLELERIIGPLMAMLLVFQRDPNQRLHSSSKVISAARVFTTLRTVRRGSDGLFII